MKQVRPSFLMFCIFLEMAPSVAFSVRLHEHTQLSDSPCVYETVDLNIGDGYDEFTGKCKNNVLSK